MAFSLDVRKRREDAGMGDPAGGVEVPWIHVPIYQHVLQIDDLQGELAGDDVQLPEAPSVEELLLHVDLVQDVQARAFSDALPVLVKKKLFLPVVVQVLEVDVLLFPCRLGESSESPS